MRQRAAAADFANGGRRGDADLTKELAAARKELADLKKKAISKPSAPSVVDLEAMDEDGGDDGKCGFSFSLAHHNALLAIYTEAGATADAAKVSEAIVVQKRAKQAAKPPKQQMHNAEVQVEKLQKRVAKLEGDTDEHKEAIIVAQARLESHLAEVDRVKGLLQEAQARRLEIYQSTSLSTPSPPARPQRPALTAVMPSTSFASSQPGRASSKPSRPSPAESGSTSLPFLPKSVWKTISLSKQLEKQKQLEQQQHRRQQQQHQPQQQQQPHR